MMYGKIQLVIITIILITMTIAFSKGGTEQNKVPYSSFEDVPNAAWERLSKKKIYFGHQSVGNNILTGIAKIMNKNCNINLNIVKTIDPSQFNHGIFAHFPIGDNTKSQSKVDSFVDYITKGIGAKADAVAMKFCYIDFNAKTNVKEVFDSYKSAIERVKKQYPSLKVIHMTAPLSEIQKGPKAWVKRIIGKSISGIDDNIKRLEYNDLLIQNYGNKDPIFDLAKAESTYPDGKREIFQKDGKTYYAMVPAYSDDGGHLNKNGKKKVAEQFLLFLVNNV